MVENNIYKFFAKEYAPFINYFIVWPNDFLDCLKNLANKQGCVRDYHGYELEKDFSITFFDDSDNDININMDDFLIMIEPLKYNYLVKYPDKEEEVNNLIDKIKLSSLT